MCIPRMLKVQDKCHCHSTVSHRVHPSAFYLSASVSWGFRNKISSMLGFENKIGEIVPTRPSGTFIKVSWGAWHVFLMGYHQTEVYPEGPFVVGLC